MDKLKQLETFVSVATRGSLKGKFTWTTMPERLQSQGVSWKVYQDPAGGVFDNVLPYFAAYNTPGELADRGLNTTYPKDFMSDVKHNALPSVSWVLTNLAATARWRESRRWATTPARS